MDYKGNVIFVLLGEKEGEMRKKRIGKKKGGEQLITLFLVVLGS